MLTAPRMSEERLSELFAALAHPNRLRIVEFLRGGERCSCEIQPALGLEQSNLSRHIKILTGAGVLRSRRDGLRLMLEVADPIVFEMIERGGHMLGVKPRPRARRVAR